MFNDLLASGGSPGGASAPQPGHPSGPAQDVNAPPGMPPGPTGAAPTLPNPSNNGLGTSGADTDVKLLSQRYFDLLIERGVPTAMMMRTLQYVSNAIRRDGEGARPMLERRIRNLETGCRRRLRAWWLWYARCAVPLRTWGWLWRILWGVRVLWWIRRLWVLRCAVSWRANGPHGSHLSLSLYVGTRR